MPEHLYELLLKVYTGGRKIITLSDLSKTLFSEQLFNSFKDAVFPNKCFSCDSFFHKKENLSYLENEEVCSNPYTNFYNLMSPFLCSDCIKEFAPFTVPFCTRCGFVFKSREGENHLCEKCIRKEPYCRYVRSAGIYGKSFMDIIHKYKYGGKTRLADPFGKLLFYGYLKYFKDTGHDFIIPIPLHKTKLRSRGFNQAHLIVKN